METIKIKMNNFIVNLKGERKDYFNQYNFVNV